MAFKTLTYMGLEHIRKTGDYTDIRFDFSIVDTAFVEGPEEETNTSLIEVLVRISRSLGIQWKLESPQLEKVLYEFAKCHLQKKIKAGTDTSNERIDLNAYTAARDCPYNPEGIFMIPGIPFEIEVNRPIGYRKS